DEDARHQLVLRIAARGVAHHALLFAELALEVERVLPVELGGRFCPRRLVGTLLGGLRHGGLLGRRCCAFAADYRPSGRSARRRSAPLLPKESGRCWGREVRLSRTGRARSSAG